MKLRLGQPVNSLDGPWGVLADIVIEPKAEAVTHVVIESEHAYRLARLVPIWMVTSDDESLTVELHAEHIRQLQAASFSDHVRYTDPINLGEEWDVGTEDIVSAPIAEMDAGRWGDSGFVDVVYHRIPRGEVEIRDRSRVYSSDERDVGHVGGIITDDDHVAGIAVRVGLPGRRHDVFVTIDQIASVRNDRVMLRLTHDAVRSLPKTEAFDDGEASVIELSRERVEAAAGMVAEAGQRLATRAKSMLNLRG